MGIILGSNFTLNTALPLDDRAKVTDLTARDAILAGRRWQGMVVYVVADNKSYQLKAGVTNADWVEFGTGGSAVTFVTNDFSGTGVQTAFTLSVDPTDIVNTDVYISGVYQQKNSAYTVVGTTLTFTSPPPLGTNNIEVKIGAPSVTGGSFTAPNGYSLRFNETFVSSDLQSAINGILKISYAAPAISLSGAGSGTIREKGASVASAPLSATTTKTAKDIQRVEFFRGVTSLFVSDPVAAPTGGVVTYTDATPFTNNVSYTAQVTDVVAGAGGPTTVTSNTVNYQFVYPYYSDAGAVGLTPAAVGALTKDISASSNKVKTFAATNGQVFYFAYPAAYPALTSILDASNFETITDWTLTTANITGLDATAQSYKIYKFNNPVVAGSYLFTFKQ